eukprot:gene951-915_t
MQKLIAKLLAALVSVGASQAKPEQKTVEIEWQGDFRLWGPGLENISKEELRKIVFDVLQSEDDFMTFNWPDQGSDDARPKSDDQKDASNNSQDSLNGKENPKRPPGDPRYDHWDQFIGVDFDAPDPDMEEIHIYPTSWIQPVANPFTEYPKVINLEWRGATKVWSAEGRPTAQQLQELVPGLIAEQFPNIVSLQKLSIPNAESVPEEVVPPSSTSAPPAGVQEGGVGGVKEEVMLSSSVDVSLSTEEDATKNSAVLHESASAQVPRDLESLARKAHKNGDISSDKKRFLDRRRVRVESGPVGATSVSDQSSSTHASSEVSDGPADDSSGVMIPANDVGNGSEKTEINKISTTCASAVGDDDGERLDDHLGDGEGLHAAAPKVVDLDSAMALARLHFEGTSVKPSSPAAAMEILSQTFKGESLYVLAAKQQRWDDIEYMVGRGVPITERDRDEITRLMKRAAVLEDERFARSILLVPKFGCPICGDIISSEDENPRVSFWECDDDQGNEVHHVCESCLRKWIGYRVSANELANCPLCRNNRVRNPETAANYGWALPDPTKAQKNLNQKKKFILQKGNDLLDDHEQKRDLIEFRKAFAHEQKFRTVTELRRKFKIKERLNCEKFNSCWRQAFRSVAEQYIEKDRFHEQKLRTVTELKEKFKITERLNWGKLIPWRQACRSVAEQHIEKDIAADFELCSVCQQLSPVKDLDWFWICDEDESRRHRFHAQCIKDMLQSISEESRIHVPCPICRSQKWGHREIANNWGWGVGTCSICKKIGSADDPLHSFWSCSDIPTDRHRFHASCAEKFVRDEVAQSRTPGCPHSPGFPHSDCPSREDADRGWLSRDISKDWGWQKFPDADPAKAQRLHALLVSVRTIPGLVLKNTLRQLAQGNAHPDDLPRKDNVIAGSQAEQVQVVPRAEIQQV